MPSAPASSDADVETGSDRGVLGFAPWVDAFVMWAVALFVAVWIGARGPFATYGGVDEAPYPGSGLFSGWFRFDGNWYAQISTSGYWFAGADRQSAVAFFPAYPGVLWGLHSVTSVSVKLLGSLVTIACGLGAFLAIFKWFRDHVTDRVARVALVTLLVYPYVFYLFGAVYGDALFLLAVAAAFDAGDALIEAGEIARYDVLIINDASTDSTGKLADEMAAADERVSVVHHEINRKLGGTLKTGFENAKGELVLYNDADLPFDMAEVSKAVRLLRLYEADVVSAYRFDRTGEGGRRLLYSYVYNRLIQTVFGLRLRDMNFAFKLMRRSLLDNIELRSEGSFIDVELLARAQKLGFSIVQFGVDYFPRTRGISTLSSNSVIFKILREMYELRSELQALEPLPLEVRQPWNSGGGASS